MGCQVQTTNEKQIPLKPFKEKVQCNKVHMLSLLVISPRSLKETDFSKLSLLIEWQQTGYKNIKCTSRQHKYPKTSKTKG